MKHGGLRDVWNELRSSLWAVPALMVALAAVLAFVLLWLDRNVMPRFDDTLWFLFAGTADGAREILAVVAGALITVVSVAFSVTILAFQQAANRYSPRVLKSFRRDRGNKIVLGWYIGTFTYALLVLRAIRQPGDDGSGGFTPALAIAGALALALVSVGLLVWFVHHVAESIQVAYILASIRRDLDDELETMFPCRLGREGEDPERATALFRREMHALAGEELVVRSDAEGYVRRIAEHALARAIPEGAYLVWIVVPIGRYVRPGSVLARVFSRRPIDRSAQDALQRAFVVSRERSVEQDPAFGFRQMVDIAVKALSPGVNDPTTAEEALAHIGAATAFVAGREMPSTAREMSGTRVLLEAPTFDDYVELAFGQIRREAMRQPHVLLRLLDVLCDVADAIRSEARARSIRAQLSRIEEALPSAAIAGEDARAVRARLVEVEDALEGALERARFESRPILNHPRVGAWATIAATRASRPSTA